MNRRSVLVGLSVALALAPSAGFPCSTANCPLVTQTQDGVRSKGTWTIDFGYRFMRQNAAGDVGSPDTLPVAPLIDFERQLVLDGHHADASMRHSLLQIDMGYGISSKVTLGLSIPLLSDRLHRQFDLEGNVGVPHNLHTPTDANSGELVLAGSPSAHSSRGIGDIQLGGTFAAFTTSRHSLVLRAGIKAPTGDYKIRDTFGSIERPDLQPGSGTWDMTGAAQYQHRLGSSEWSVFLGGWGGLNGTNDLNYSFGDQISLTAGITRATPGRLRLSLQAGFLAIARDRFLGAPVTATGLRSWTVTPGGRLRLGPGLSAYLFAKVPVANRVHEAQLRPRVDILSGFSRTF